MKHTKFKESKINKAVYSLLEGAGGKKNLTASFQTTKTCNGSLLTYQENFTHNWKAHCL